MRLGIADHLGWAVAVTASTDHEVLDRRRIELIDPTLSAAPIHYDRGRSDLPTIEAAIAEARHDIARCATAAFDELESDLHEPIRSISLRTWPDDFPTDLEILTRSPYEARADAVMYRQVLAETAANRGWDVHLYDAKQVLTHAAGLLAERADEVIQGPKARLGAPWGKDHRVALAATVVAAG